MAKKPQIPPKKNQKKGRSGWQKFKNRLSFLILLGFSATAFWYGWVSYHIEQGEKALLFSKTNGFEDELIEAGEFCWRWQRLIPTNLNIYPIPQTELNRAIIMEGNLPSWQLYSAYGGSQADFSYRCEIEISYSLEEEYIIGQITQGLWDPMALEDHFETLDQLLGQWIIDELPREELIAWSTGGQEGSQNIQNWLEDYFPYLKINSIQLVTLDFPDYELYLLLRENYFQYMDERHEAELAALEALALDQQDLENRLSQLEEYGRLITEYPLLLDLFALENRPEDLF